MLIVGAGEGTPLVFGCILAHKPSQKKDISSSLKNFKIVLAIKAIFVLCLWKTETMCTMALNREEENSQSANQQRREYSALNWTCISLLPKQGSGNLKQRMEQKGCRSQRTGKRAMKCYLLDMTWLLDA